MMIARGGRWPGLWRGDEWGVFPPSWSRALCLQVGEQGSYVLAVEPQVRHRDLVVLRVQRGSDGITRGEHLVGCRKIAGQPGAVAPVRHAGEIGSDQVPISDGVTADAAGADEVPAPVKVEGPRLGIARGRLLAPPAEERAHRRRQEPRIVLGGALHPLTARLIP